MTETRDPVILERRKRLREAAPVVEPKDEDRPEPVSVRVVREWRRYWGQDDSANRATAGRN